MPSVFSLNLYMQPLLRTSNNYAQLVISKKKFVLTAIYFGITQLFNFFIFKKNDKIVSFSKSCNFLIKM